MGELIRRENFLVDLARKRRDRKGTILLIELRSPDLAPCDRDEIRVLAHLSRRARIVSNNHIFPMQDSFQKCLNKIPLQNISSMHIFGQLWAELFLLISKTQPANRPVPHAPHPLHTPDSVTCR